MLPVTEETISLWDHIPTAPVDGSERNARNPRACDRHLAVDCPTCIGERTRERVRDAWL